MTALAFALGFAVGVALANSSWCATVISAGRYRVLYVRHGRSGHQWAIRLPDMRRPLRPSLERW